MSNSSIITLRQFLEKGKTFVIPDYQRGYIWGKSRGTGKNSVEYIIESITNSITNDRELFLQGITVTESDNEIILIDGQQRTTFFYLLLSVLQFKDIDFNIRYPIRTESEKFLKVLKNLSTAELDSIAEDDDEDFQDLYYFKKTVKLIREHKSKLDVNYILDSIKFLYINIPRDKAKLVFTMMNGNKANMKTEEIIKAEMLRLVSIDPTKSDKEKISEAERWEQNLLRSKYAREWDKWLYWWNRKEVIKFYQTDGDVLGLLLKTYYLLSKDNKEFNFENFRDSKLRSTIGNNDLAAKKVFYNLRHIQKRFEDIYNSICDDIRLHNKVGCILKLFSDPKEKMRFIIWFFNIKDQSLIESLIDAYYKYTILGLSHFQIELYLSSKDKGDLNKTEKEKKVAKEVQDEIEILIQTISDPLLYDRSEKEREHAYRQLLRRNIEEDTRLGRPFDFTIWDERSLEHIFPKSRVSYEGKTDISENVEFDRKMFISKESGELEGSEHCIGNLALLYKNENSQFGAKTVEEKKMFYFEQEDPNNRFKSRHLLHTISMFATGDWSSEKSSDQESRPAVVNTIIKNKDKFIEEVQKYYEK